MELHPLGFGIAAFDEPWPAVDVHQAPVVVVVHRGAQDAHVDLLTARVVHVLGAGGERGQTLTTREMGRVCRTSPRAAGKETTIQWPSNDFPLQRTRRDPFTL